MNIWKKPWFIPIVLAALIIIAGQLYTAGKLTKAEMLPKQEISSQLAMIYDGEVKDLILDGSVYKAKVSRAGAEYAVEVDAESGKIISLIQMKESTKTDLVMKTEHGEKALADESDPTSTKVTDEADTKSETPQNTVLISKQQAEKIALAQLPSGMVGEIDDVDFEKSTDGGYYLVDIDIITDDDRDEVTYQIHAISGKVLTVTWDD